MNRHLPMRMTMRKAIMPRSNTADPVAIDELRTRILESFSALSVKIGSDDLDAALSKAERERLTPLSFLDSLIRDPATRRRERCIARRIHEAGFPENKTLETFDWDFNAAVIKRHEI